MKILLVSNMYPDRANPQFGIFVKNCEEILLSNNIEVEKIVCNKKKNKIAKVIQYLIFYVKTLVTLLVCNYDYVYVHYLSHSSLPIILAKKIKKKIYIVSNVHGSDVIPQNKKHHLLNGIGKICAELSEFVIVPSSYFKEEIIKRWEVNSEKVCVFPSGGINNKIFYPKMDKDEFKNKFKLRKEYEYIGFVGRLEIGKGWDVLLNSINYMKNNNLIEKYKFIFVGNGKEEKNFYDMISKLGLNEFIIHINFLKHEDLADLYNCLELFCFPTEVSESLGLVGIEALGCGVPVIASNFGGPTSYVINNYNGYLFTKGDYKDLSEKIYKFLLLDKEEKDKMKKNAYKSSIKYWSENVKNDLIEIFKKNKN